MPSINSRKAIGTDTQYTPVSTQYTTASISASPHSDPSNLQMAGGSGSLMAIVGGNRVPMRGILPIEQMTDTDLSRFFPYSAYFDRIPKYTYYALLNSK